MAQLASVLAWGASGRQFESDHSDLSCSPGQLFLCDMYYTYILFSEKLNRYYTGQSHDIDSRLVEHNSGKGIYSGRAQDWVIVSTQIFETRAEAMHLETKIKKRGARRFLSDLKG